MMAPMASGTVLAAETPKTTTVKYTVTESYEWSVPTTITFTSDNTTITAGDDSGATQKVKVTKNVIAEGTKLRITAKGSGTDGAFTIVPTGKSHTLAYTIKVDNASEALAVGGTVLDVAAGTNTGSTNLTFTLTKDNVEQAGEYTGTVSYSAEVVAQSSN